MFAIGIIQANGGEESKALVGIPGLGHILITAGIIIYTATINKALKSSPVKYSVENMPTVYKQKIISFVIVPMSGSPCDLELSNRDSTLQIGHV